MFPATLSHLQCPSCGGELALAKPAPAKDGDVLSGDIVCGGCKGRYPILAGVALLVPDVLGYLLEHVKGISRQVRDDAIPAQYRKEYARARKEVEGGEFEEDLEAERVISLYVMNHYLRAGGTESPWWKSRADAAGSPLIDRLIRENWNDGPVAVIARALEEEARPAPSSLVELGCGSGGLLSALAPRLGGYLGVDTSFSSIAVARHLELGAPYRGEFRFPEDLLNGPVSRSVPLPRSSRKPSAGFDYVVGDVLQPPLKPGRWGLSAALNLIDMVPEPAALPELQRKLLAKGGTAIQSCPYIWHPGVAEELRKLLPSEVRDSAAAVEWMYRKAGFRITRSIAHTPWLFFKHVRQIEVYSVHLFFAAG